MLAELEFEELIIKSVQSFKLLLKSSAAVFVTLALSACVAEQIRQIPDEARLRDRVASVHAAIGRGDVELWYSMTPPSLRELMTLADFKRDIRWETVGSKRPPQQWQAEIGKLCSCRRDNFLRCVVSVRVGISDPEKVLIQDLPLETWEYTGEDWYLAYIGNSTGGRCPGE